MAEMLQTIKGAWKAPELRKKILFTVFILLIYRLGNAVPVPYVDVAALKEYFDTTLSSTVLGLYNAMSGSAFSRATVFALSINPYINSSIIMQLLCIAVPQLERLQKDGGEEGRKKIASITRYVTVGLALIMGFAYYVHAAELWPADPDRRTHRHRDRHHLHRRLRLRHVAGRADYRVRYRQRHLHYPVCQHHLPDSFRRQLMRLPTSQAVLRASAACW